MHGGSPGCRRSVRRLGDGRRLRARLRDFVRADPAARIVPAVQHVGQHVRDFVVGQLRHRRHRRIVVVAVDRHLAVQAVQQDADRALRVRGEEVGAGERREHARQAGAGTLVAHRAGAREHRAARFHLRGQRQRRGARGGARPDGRGAALHAGRGAGRAGRARTRRRGDGVAAVRRVELLARIDRLVLRAVHLQDRERALVERAEDRVIDERVVARHARVEFDRRRAAGRNQRCLHVVLRDVRAVRAHLVEHRADHVETRHEIRAAVADEQAHRLVGARAHRTLARQRAFGAVEDDVGRALVDRLVHVERLQALLAILAVRVEVALHHVVFAVDLRQSLGRLDENQAVHPVRDVHADGRGRAVIDEEPLVERLEREARFVARRGEARRRAAARARHRVQIDVVRHFAVRTILEMEFDRVALPHADEVAGHRAAEGPERVVHAVGDRQHFLDHFEIDDDLRRVAARDRRRHVRRADERRVKRLALRRAEIAGHLARGGARLRARRDHRAEQDGQERGAQLATDRLQVFHD
ncbi:hypothetical protein X947_4295 [Burkholderia pseudomallei MSHR7334]|nr:hypothetical protein X947_4295 [Burkholderia pseudomallei MSHR7334]